MPAITVPGTGNNDTLTVSVAGPDSGSFILNGGAPSPFSSATSFTFNASTGADTFIIANPVSGLFGPPSGVTFNGGGQAGDTLEVLGGSAFNESDDTSSLNYTTLEVQRVAISGSSGTFTLTFNGQTTAPLSFNATAAQVQAALSALSNIANAGGVTVDKSGSQFTIFFTNASSPSDQAQITGAGSAGTTVTASTLANGGTHLVIFTGTSSIIDSVGPERPGDSLHLTVDAPGNQTTIADGPLLNGQQTTVVSGVSGAFPTIEVANKTVLTVNGAKIGQMVFSNPHPEAGLTVLDVSGGAMTQSSAPDGVANAVAPVIKLQIPLGTGGIGTSATAPLEVDVTNFLSADTANGGGNIFITDTSGGFPVSGIRAGTGNVVLKSLGSGLTAASPNDDSADVSGNVVTLIAAGPSTGDAGQIGSRDPSTHQPLFLEVDAKVLNASTNNSELFISSVGFSGVAIGSVNAGNNSADLRLDGGTMTSQTVDGVADIVSQFASFDTTIVGGSFGASQASPLEINASAFDVATSLGSAHIRDTAADVSLREADITGGDLTVETSGRLELRNSARATGNITFQTGGDFVFGPDDNGQFTAGGTIQIVVDADNDAGVGASVTITNPLSAASIIVAGGADGDTLTLGPAVTANVSLFGNGGNDTITGGSGNDTIDGGAGDDTASYAGARLDYHVDQLANGDLQITDLRPGSPDGTDILHAIEHVAFSDGTVTSTSLVMPAPVHWSASVDIGTHPAGYQPVATGDFSGDGTSDLLWFNPGNHDVDLWEISNGHWAGSVDIGTHPAGYQPVGAGDFNHDGTSDVLWYNAATTDTEVWLLSNGHWAGSVDVGTHPAGYQPVGIGDFNHDGTSDVLWYNAATTDTEVWLLSNGHWSASVDVGTHPAGYQPVGVGDFNHDGTNDVLWYNAATTDTEVWLLSNGHWSASVDVGTHPAGYQPVGVGDFNHDGTSDVLWFNPTTRDAEVWRIFNGHWAGSDDLGTHPAGYQPVSVGDFNHDGVADVIWHNASSNDIDEWLLANG
jgi:hypothetical protein